VRFLVRLCDKQGDASTVTIDLCIESIELVFLSLKEVINDQSCSCLERRVVRFSPTFKMLSGVFLIWFLLKIQEF